VQVKKDIFDWGTHQALVTDRNGIKVIKVNSNGFEIKGQAKGYACLKPDGTMNVKADGTVGRADEHCIFHHNYCTNYGGDPIYYRLAASKNGNPSHFGHGQCGMKESEVEEKCGKWAGCAGVVCVPPTTNGVNPESYTVCFARSKASLDWVKPFGQHPLEVNAIDKAHYGVFNKVRPVRQHYGKCKGNYFAAGAGFGPCFLAAAKLCHSSKM
jgi:hypothetical protein